VGRDLGVTVGLGVELGVAVGVAVAVGVTVAVDVGVAVTVGVVVAEGVAVAPGLAVGVGEGLASWINSIRPPLPNWLAWTAFAPPTTYCPFVETSTENAEPGKLIWPIN
jgi:hypothetical protein